VDERFVICEECGLRYGQITASHLRGHGLAMWEYRGKYPGSPLVTQEHIDRAIGHLWNHAGVCSNPRDEEDRRERIRRSNSGKEFTEEHCRHLSERVTGWQSTPYARKANSEGLKRWWAVPENRDLRVGQIVEAARLRPNKVEEVLLEFLEDISSSDWKYNDGWFILAGKVPDFVNVNGQKKVIELFGNFWHPGPWEEEERIKLFSQFGYKTLVVWEDEVFIGNSELVSKLRSFVQI